MLDKSKIQCFIREKDQTGCCGKCFISTDCVPWFWNIIFKYCTGSKEEQTEFYKIFHHECDKSELYTMFKFSEEDEKELKAYFH